MSPQKNILSHKPEGIDPKNSSKVYFACHTEDLSEYFETFCDEILSVSRSHGITCTLWYRDPAVILTAESRKDLLDQLGEMQLLVVPVTEKLLLDRQNTMQLEVAFAKQHRIPILPILLDPTLISSYSLPENFGNLQFLCKNDPDPTALPYQKKLEEYITSVLVGDDLRKKIQSAFDAYIFLSYRKKDRRYAQEIMRLIHKNDFCRDIAIWYDEFLTPGESFNQSIRIALEKSDLFALVVTPHILEPENYVIAHEYPMAESAKKATIPLEYISTDRAELDRCFKNLPPCINVHDSAVLSDILLQNLKKAAISESDSSPEHNYLIGLAYLNGIDVETDYDRAYTLLLSSADSGLPEPMLTLATMYRTGKGVQQNARQCIYWLQRATDRYEALAQADPNTYTKPYINGLNIVSSHYHSMGDVRMSAAMAEKAIQQCKLAFKKSSDDYYVATALLAYFTLAGASVALKYGNRHTINYTAIQRELLAHLLEAETFFKKCHRKPEQNTSLYNVTGLLYSQILSCYLQTGNQLKVLQYQKKLDKIFALTSGACLSSLYQMVFAFSKRKNLTTQDFLEYIDFCMEYLEKWPAQFDIHRRKQFLMSILPTTGGVLQMIEGLLETGEIDLGTAKDYAYRYGYAFKDVDFHKMPNTSLMAFASLYHSLGRMEVQDNDPQAAQRLFQQYYRISLHMFKQYPTEDGLNMVVSAATTLASHYAQRSPLAMEEEHYQHAEKALKTALTCWKQFYGTAPDTLAGKGTFDLIYNGLMLLAARAKKYHQASIHAFRLYEMAFQQYHSSKKTSDFLNVMEYNYQMSYYLFLHTSSLYTEEILDKETLSHLSEDLARIEEQLTANIEAYTDLLFGDRKLNFPPDTAEVLTIKLCENMFLMATVYDLMDREQEALSMMQSFLDTTAFLQNVTELEENIQLAKELLSTEKG